MSVGEPDYTLSSEVFFFYVQSWIQAIRDKPETLIRAIKDAQAAAAYMDYKAGLITNKEYEKACGSVLEVKQKERDRER